MKNPLSRFPLAVALGAIVAVAPAGAQVPARPALVISASIRPAVVFAANELALTLTDKGLIPIIVDPGPVDDLGDLSQYACVWDLRVDTALPTQDVPRFSAYAGGGGSLFFSGEHAVFQPRNDSVTALIAALGGGAPVADPVATGSTVAHDILEPVNPAHLLSRECESVFEVDYDGVDNGHFLNPGTGTWLTGAPARASAVSWDRGSLAGAPTARIIAALDINWLAPAPDGTLDHRQSSPLFPTENRKMVRNMVSYLCDVCCLLPPLSPADPASPLSPQSACSAASPTSSPTSN